MRESDGCSSRISGASLVCVCVCVCLFLSFYLWSKRRRRLRRLMVFSEEIRDNKPGGGPFFPTTQSFRSGTFETRSPPLFFVTGRCLSSKNKEEELVIFHHSVRGQDKHSHRRVLYTERVPYERSGGGRLFLPLTVNKTGDVSRLPMMF